MADQPNSTRRALIKAFPFIGVVAATPVAAMSLPEDPATRVYRLSRELSAALDEFVDGEFRAIIEPDSKSNCPVLFQNMRTRGA